MNSLVTGGTGGIGRAVATELTRRGHRVLTVGRSPDATFRADLSLLHDTAGVADEVHAHTDRLDAIVLCAGAFALTPEWTEEGLERTYALNYLSRFLLIRRLTPLLRPGARIVLVANAGRYRDTLDRPLRRGLNVSGRSQFANDLLAVELAERLPRIRVSCVFPGPAATGVFRNARGVPRLLRPVLTRMGDLLGAAPEKAAETPVFLADDPAATGGFWGPGCKPLRIPGRVLRPERRRAVWAATEETLTAGLACGRGHPRIRR